MTGKSKKVVQREITKITRNTRGGAMLSLKGVKEPKEVTINYLTKHQPKVGGFYNEVTGSDDSYSHTKTFVAKKKAPKKKAPKK